LRLGEEKEEEEEEEEETNHRAKIWPVLLHMGGHNKRK